MVSEKPQVSRSNFARPIIRIRGGEEYRLLLLTGSIFWVGTHYFKRQLLCPGKQCPVCFGESAVTKGYALVKPTHGEMQRPSVLETTNLPWTSLTEQAMSQSIAVAEGLVFRAARRRNNSPLTMTMEGAVKATEHPNAYHTLLAAIAVIYDLPLPAKEESATKWSKRVASSAALKVATATKN